MAAAWLAGTNCAALCAVKRATLVTITSVRTPTIRAAKLMMRTIGWASRWCSLFMWAPVGGVCTVRRQKKRKRFTGRLQHSRYSRPGFCPPRDLHLEDGSHLDRTYLRTGNAGRQLIGFLLILAVEHVVTDQLLLARAGRPGRVLALAASDPHRCRRRARGQDRKS